LKGSDSFMTAKKSFSPFLWWESESVISVTEQATMKIHHWTAGPSLPFLSGLFIAILRANYQPEMAYFLNEVLHFHASLIIAIMLVRKKVAADRNFKGRASRLNTSQKIPFYACTSRLLPVTRIFVRIIFGKENFEIKLYDSFL